MNYELLGLVFVRNHFFFVLFCFYVNSFWFVDAGRIFGRGGAMLQTKDCVTSAGLLL